MSEATPAPKIRKALTAEQTDARNARRRDLTADRRRDAVAVKQRTAAKKTKPKGSRKKMKRTTGRKTRTDWDSIIYKLQHGPKSTTVRRVCSTSGVAQVTRVRLLNAYDGIEAETKGATLILSRA